MFRAASAAHPMRLLEGRGAQKVKQKCRRGSGAIVLLSEDKKPVLRWEFFEAWPAKLDGPSLNAKNNEVAIETLELVVEKLEFKKL